jgi:hypothetical protein
MPPAPEVSVTAPNSEIMGPPTDSNTLDWQFPAHPSGSSLNPNVEMKLQLLTSEVQYLTARIQLLENTQQQAKTDIEDFTTWSKKMEKHSEGINDTLLELFDIVRKPEFIRGVLEGRSEPSSQSARKK